MSDFNHDLIADLRANGGHATSGPFVGRPMVILPTVGAKSGATREIPLVYSRARVEHEKAQVLKLVPGR